ncbi:hypothetical protein TNCV_983111 [Trichonephila clavipes]|nr:hypothetical protein TNCV_983111 [Trichonephila clavipes]
MPAMTRYLAQLATTALPAGGKPATLGFQSEYATSKPPKCIAAGITWICNSGLVISARCSSTKKEQKDSGKKKDMAYAHVSFLKVCRTLQNTHPCELQFSSAHRIRRNKVKEKRANKGNSFLCKSLLGTNSLGQLFLNCGAYTPGVSRAVIRGPKKWVFEVIQYQHSPSVTHRLFPAQILLRNLITYPTD